MSDKRNLSARRREPRSDEDVCEAACRMVRALGGRTASADPDGLRLLHLVAMELDAATAHAVAGFRSNGWSDAEIGRELGVTKQAVQQRFPRAVSSTSGACR